MFEPTRTRIPNDDPERAAAPALSVPTRLPWITCPVFVPSPMIIWA